MRRVYEAGSAQVPVSRRIPVRFFIARPANKHLNRIREELRRRPWGGDANRSVSGGSCRCMRQRGTLRFLLDERNNFSSRSALPLFCGGKDRFHIKAVLGGLFLAKTSHFIHNVIIVNSLLHLETMPPLIQLSS